MANLRDLNIPDDLYAQLQELAQVENSTINTQVITLIKTALSAKIKHIEEEKRRNVPKLLEEIRVRREKRRTDIQWPDSTALIREDRDR
jgi:antitoxin FitA